jgi:hypothetical protein
VGASAAAPAPWTIRAASSITGSEAKPPARLAAVKTTAPKMNTRLRPKRSPALAASSRSWLRQADAPLGLAEDHVGEVEV